MQVVQKNVCVSNTTVFRTPSWICQWLITLLSFVCVVQWKQEAGFKAVTEDSAFLCESHGARQCKSSANY